MTGGSETTCPECGGKFKPGEAVSLGDGEVECPRCFGPVPFGVLAATPAPHASADKERAKAREAPTRAPEPPAVTNVVNHAPVPTLSVETVSATWGEELYTPKQFNSFRVGPFSGTTTVRPGETRAQAAGRLMLDLETLATEAFETKRAGYMTRLSRVLRAES